MVNKYAKPCYLILLLLPLLGQAAGSTLYRVEKVFDGDTILLNDGRKIRFLGINTPEVAGKDKSAEAGGEQARHWLLQRLEQQGISLEEDVEKQDKYGRTLAYVFSEDHQLINLELVKNGLASVSIFPPNLKYTDSLLEAQRSAEQAHLGIWGQPDYAPLAFQHLNENNYHGWKRITGQIQAIKQGAESSYLQFSDHVAIQVENQYGGWFPKLADYLGKTLEVRGWLHKSKDRYVLPVKHPGSIKILKP